MIQIRTVLCPIDFSQYSRRVLEQAMAVATHCGATVRVLHVVPADAAPAAFVEPPVPPPQQSATPDDLRAAREEVDRFLAPARGAAVELETEILPGDPASAIVDRASAGESDLVVMGTHGRTGLKRLVLGSVAEKVVRRAPCPVLTVRAESIAATIPRRVLCPIDFSESSQRALRWALDLSARLGARLQVLHVLEPRPGVPHLVGLGEAEHSALLRKQAHVMVGRSVSEVADDGDGEHLPPIERTVVRGLPQREIVGVARLEGVDLIVMGIHGHGVVDRMLFGSAADQVVRSASCPVLTVRARPEPLERRQGEGMRTAASR